MIQAIYMSIFLLTGYVGLILHSTPVATVSHSTVVGTMRVLCSYHINSSFSAFCHCSVKSILIVPSMVLRLTVATAVLPNMRPM